MHPLAVPSAAPGDTGSPFSPVRLSMRSPMLIGPGSTFGGCSSLSDVWMVDRQTVIETAEFSRNGWMSASTVLDSIQSSDQTILMYSPVAAPIAFRQFGTGPRLLSLRRIRTLGSEARSSIVLSDPSVLALSDTTTSRLRYVWSSALVTARRSVSARLKVGMTTLTSGGPTLIAPPVSSTRASSRLGTVVSAFVLVSWS